MATPISVRHLLNGKPIENPQELQKALDLDLVGNLMINPRWPFTEEERKAPSPGNQLALVLLNILLNHVDKENFPEVVKRIGIRYLCGESPLQFPTNDISDLKPVFLRLRKWTTLGWSMETNLPEVPDEEFVSGVIAKETAELTTRIRQSIEGVDIYLKGL